MALDLTGLAGHDPGRRQPARDARSVVPGLDIADIGPATLICSAASGLAGPKPPGQRPPNPHSAQPPRPLTTRAFLPWRLSNAGPVARGITVGDGPASETRHISDRSQHEHRTTVDRPAPDIPTIGGWRWQPASGQGRRGARTHSSGGCRKPGLAPHGLRPACARSAATTSPRQPSCLVVLRSGCAPTPTRRAGPANTIARSRGTTANKATRRAELSPVTASRE